MFKVVGATDIATPTLPDVPIALVKLIIGAEAATDMLTVAVVEPTEFVAVTVYEVEVRVAVGVPEITHVVGFIDAHAGSVGDVLHDVITEP